MIVHIRDFGMIQSADIDISDMVILVGDNNSGKTYLMQLIYGLYYLLIGEEMTLMFSGYENVPIDVNRSTLDTTDSFMSEFQDEINRFIDKKKDALIKDIFYTNTLSIGELSVEFSHNASSYYFEYEEDGVADETEWRNYSFYRDKKILFVLRVSRNLDNTSLTRVLRRNLIYIYIMDMLGFPDDPVSWRREPSLFIPAARSGMMLLYANYLSSVMKTEDGNYVKAEKNTDNSENEFGLTRPMYNFLLFLLEYKTSGQLSTENRELIDFIDKEIIRGKLEKVGNTMRYMPENVDHSIPIYLSSSLATELSPIYQVLSGVKRYNVILYDEIETCQHPTKQIQLARLLFRMVNAGYKMIVSTHSDTMTTAINNLATLSTKENRVKLAHKLGYDEADLINNSKKIKAYQFLTDKGKTEVREIPDHLSIGIGYDFDIFNNANDKIYRDALTIAGGKI